ncbi:MAG: fibronectin type III domain-containing protein [Thermoplasmata archaeon]|nr:fibronectin type III domain-containing protein [Thermoplasmata archaeon]
MRQPVATSHVVAPVRRWTIGVSTLVLFALLIAPSLPSASAARPFGGITLSVAGDSPGGIGLSWTPAGGGSLLFTNYEVDRSTGGSGGPWTSVATPTNALATTLYQDGLNPGTTYWWRVVMNQTGLSPVISNVVTQPQPRTASLAVALAGATSVNLSWTNSARYGNEVGFVSYTVLDSVNGGNLTTVTVNPSESERTATVTGLHPGSSYLFEVQTADGCQNASNCASFSSPSVSISNGARSDIPGPLAATVVSAPTTLVQGVRGAFSCLATGGTSPRLYDWKFGDGATAAGRNVSHVFTKTGTYAVTCLVRDAVGDKTNASTSLAVTSNGSAPPGNGTGGSGGTPSAPGGGAGTTLPSASTSAPFGPLVTAALAIAFLAAIGWLAVHVGRRRGSTAAGSGPPQNGPPPGAIPTDDRPGGRPDATSPEPEVAPAPPVGVGRTHPSASPRDLDELMDQLDGLPSSGR